MEYASKGELYDYISERRRLTERETRHFFRQIVSAVHYCHKVLYMPPLLLLISVSSPVTSGLYSGQHVIENCMVILKKPLRKYISSECMACCLWYLHV